jgi:hypothetical protein
MSRRAGFPVDSFDSILDEAIVTEELDSGWPRDRWRTAGFKPKQDEAWWRANGPKQVQAYIDWYNSQPDVRVWTTPDGRPAVELALNVNFGHHEVQMVIDQVHVAGSALLILDVKSGGHRPEEHSQLGIYASGIEIAYGIRPRFGAYFMGRGIRNQKNDNVRYVTEPVDLSDPEFSVAWYTRQFDLLEKADEAGIYMPRLSSMCGMCGVNRACAAYGGLEAHLLDPDHPHYGKAG